MIISFIYAVVFINNYNLINRRRTILPYQVSVTELRAIEQVPEELIMSHTNTTALDNFYIFIISHVYSVCPRF